MIGRKKSFEHELKSVAYVTSHGRSTVSREDKFTFNKESG